MCFRPARREQGFTLIEILVVIIIIGVLAAIAIPVFLNQRKKGVDTGLRSDLRNAIIAAEQVSVEDPERTSYFTNAEIAAAGFRKTTGNVALIAGSPADGYCLIVANARASVAVSGGSNYYYYDSKVRNPYGKTVGPPAGAQTCTSPFITAHGNWVALN